MSNFKYFALEVLLKCFRYIYSNTRRNFRYKCTIYKDPEIIRCPETLQTKNVVHLVLRYCTSIYNQKQPVYR